MTDAFRVGGWLDFRNSAIVLSLVGFLSLMGAEKAILAIVLGTLAIRGSGHGTLARRLGVITICLGIVFLTMAVRTECNALNLLLVIKGGVQFSRPDHSRYSSKAEPNRRRRWSIRPHRALVP